MVMTNKEIYIAADLLSQQFQKNTSNIQLPVKINFFLQKNINLILKMGQEIENARINIAKQYGILNNDNSFYSIPEDKEEFVNQELNDLFNLTQEVNIHKLKLNDFENINLSFDQVSAILFMIDEE